MITNFAVVEAVNARLPATEQFGDFGWSLSKTLRLHREYRRLYPEGRLLQQQGILVAVMFSCVLVAGLFLGLGPVVIVWPGAVFALLVWRIYFRKPSAS